MALALFDRIQETASASGAGAYTLAGAVATYRAFSSVYSNGDTFPYVALGATSGAWETGLGTYNTGGTISRTTFDASSTGSAISWTAETINIWVDLTAAFRMPLAAPLAVGTGRTNGLATNTLGLEQYLVPVTGSTNTYYDFTDANLANWNSAELYLFDVTTTASVGVEIGVQFYLGGTAIGNLRTATSDYANQYLQGLSTGPVAGVNATASYCTAATFYGSQVYGTARNVIGFGGTGLRAYVATHHSAFSSSTNSRILIQTTRLGTTGKVSGFRLMTSDGSAFNGGTLLLRRVS